jgi:hypothetical protein
MGVPDLTIAPALYWQRRQRTNVPHTRIGRPVNELIGQRYRHHEHYLPVRPRVYAPVPFDVL